MPRLIAALIRHGDYYQRLDTPSAWQPYALNQAGIGQAQAAVQDIAERLQQHHWQLHPVCDCSSMLRAWQTADIISSELVQQHIIDYRIQLEQYDALAERGVGSAANLSIGEIEQILADDPRYAQAPPGWKADSDYCLPFQGAESLMAAGKRVADHLQALMLQLHHQLNADTLKLVVGHGAAFRHAAYHLGVLKKDQIALLSMYHASPVYLEYTDDCGWTHIDGNWKIRNKQDRID